MAKKEPKKTIASLEERKRIHKRSLEEIELRNQLLGSPGLFQPGECSDEYLDQLSQVIKFRNGQEHTVEELVEEHLVVRNSVFRKEYYSGVGRILGLSDESISQYQKPRKVALFTIQHVYARFSSHEVFNRLCKKCPWTTIPGIRAHKLYHYLSSIGFEMLQLYIDQVIEEINHSSNYSDFLKSYCNKYKMSFQIELFS